MRRGVVRPRGHPAWYSGDDRWARRGSARKSPRPRPCRGTTNRRLARRGASLPLRECKRHRTGRSSRRPCRSSSRPCFAASARQCRSRLVDQRTCEGSRAVQDRLRRALQPKSRCAADAVSDGLANGGGQGHAPAGSNAAGDRRGRDRLSVGKCVQHSLSA